MIAYLNGSLAFKSPERLIVDVRDIGYEVEISTQTYQQLPGEGEDVNLLTYHHFTDNDQRLFGFYTEDEKQLFEVLITVKGVGPKLGLTILSGLPANQIIDAILQSDKTALTQITGIGKKTAQRMILELNDKMEDIAVASPDSSGGSAVPTEMKEEAVSALQSLGIRKSDAQKAVQAAGNNLSGDGNVETLVKKALSRINQ